MLTAWKVNDCDTIAAKTPKQAKEFITELCDYDEDGTYAVEEIERADYGLHIRYEEDYELPVLTIGQIMTLIELMGIKEPFFLCSTEW